MGTPAEFAAMVEFINRYRIEPVVDQIYKLEDAVSAFKRMEISDQMGKLVLLNS